MGQKVHPKIQRIGITRNWPSRWFAKKKDFAKLLHEDLAIKKMIRKELPDAGISEIEIQRTSGNITINVWTAKPGIIIGRQGENIAELKEKLNRKFRTNFAISIKEIKKPDLDARLVAENIAKQVEKRISYRRAAKMGIAKTMENGALGAKVQVAGRLNGVEIARSEHFVDGKIPLHTFRADIDYAYVPAQTTYGVIGIKVWIYKGEIFKKKRALHVVETIDEKTVTPEKHLQETTTDKKEFLPV